MISADTSSLSNFLKGQKTEDAELVKSALLDGHLVLTPIVVAELFSSPVMSDALKSIIGDVPLLDLKDGFWERVGSNRAEILKSGNKARLADSMIATCCLDHQVPLIARDSDYRHFEFHFKLDLRSGMDA